MSSVCEGRCAVGFGGLNPGRLGPLSEGLDKGVPRDLRYTRANLAPRELRVCFGGECLRGTQAVPDPEFKRTVKQ